MNPEGSARAREIGEALASLLREVEAGRAPPPDDVRARYPDFADELLNFLPKADTVLRDLGPLRDESPSYLLPCGEDEYFENYQLLDVVGVGGMGAVYLVFQPELRRYECLKLIKAGQFASDAARERFRREAETAAGLQHPNIVKIYRCGECDGRLFFSMEYMSGGDLTAHADRLRDDPEALAELMALVAEAVHHAHEQSKLHKDLKPANILLDGNGRPHVADFGLAQRIVAPQAAALPAAATVPSDATVEYVGAPGVIEGTPCYMAPEQAAGGTLTERTDVYGLGAILYQVLVGRPPFEGKTMTEVLARVREESPAPLAAVAPKPNPDLAAVCECCLRRDPSDRYPSAQAVADDLRRVLKGCRPIARRPGVAARLVELVTQARCGEMAVAKLGWSLWAYAVIVFLTNFAAFLLLRAGGPEWAVWGSVFASYLPLFVVLGLKIDPDLAANADATRLIWSLWVGHFLACLAVFLSLRVAHAPDFVEAFLAGYPVCAALTGLAFFVMGGIYWGPQYLMGVAWLVLAALMPFTRDWGPLEYAVLMALCNIFMGTRLRRVSRSIRALRVNPTGKESR